MFRTRWPTKRRESLVIASIIGLDLAASEHGPWFMGGTVTLDDVSYTVNIAYISRATLDSERHWTPLDLETGSVVWVPIFLRGYFGEQNSAYPSATGHRRASWQSGGLCTSPTVARVRHRVRLHTRVPQRQRQRHRRLVGPPARTRYRVRLQWLDQLQPRGVDKPQPCWR